MTTNHTSSDRTTSRRRTVRRRPSGEPPPLPREPGWLGWAWTAIGVIAAGIVLATVLAMGDNHPFAIDDAMLEAFAGIRTAGLTDVAEALHTPTDMLALLLIRLAVVIVLAVVGRFRHLVAFLGLSC